MLLGAAGDRRTDTLLRQLQSPSLSDSNRISLLNDISWSFNDLPDSSLAYAEKALALARRTGSPQSIARSLGNIGAAYNAKGNYDLALKNLFDACALYEKAGDKRATINILNSIGNTYVGNQDYSKALAAFRKCYELSLRINDEKGIALSTFGVGNIYGTRGKYDSAMYFLHLALPAFAARKNIYGEGMTYTLLGQLQTNAKKYAEALTSLDKAMILFRSIGHGYGIAMVYQSRAALLNATGQPQHAVENYLSAYDIHLRRNAFDNLRECCDSISEIYRRLGDFKNALLYRNRYMAYNDSVFNQGSRKRLLEIETRYQTEKKEKELQLKNLELAKSNTEVQSRTSMLYVSLAACFLFMILVIVAYRQYRLKKLAGMRIMVQKNIIEEKNKSITDSIRYAQYIQESILPDADMSHQMLHESFIFHSPKDIVSGDFYWIKQQGEFLYLAVVDCTGHGVPGAFMSMVGHNALNNALKSMSAPSTADVLKFLQVEVADLFRHNYRNNTVRDGMDVSLVRLDRRNRKLQFSGANNPLLLVRNGALKEFKGDKIGISAREEKQHIYSLHEPELEKGDALYLFSDGYADQFGGEKGKKFKQRRFYEFLVEISGVPMNEQKNLVATTIRDWQGKLEQVDDILVVGMRV